VTTLNRAHAHIMQMSELEADEDNIGSLNSGADSPNDIAASLSGVGIDASGHG
jgi:hypothetical protein